MTKSFTSAGRKRGQVSLEYLLLFAASVSLLLIFATSATSATQLANYAMEQHALRSSFSSISTSVNSLAFLSPGSKTTISIYLLKPAKLVTLPGGSLELLSAGEISAVTFNASSKLLTPVELEDDSLNLPAGFSKVLAVREAGLVQLSLYQAETRTGSN